MSADVLPFPAAAVVRLPVGRGDPVLLDGREAVFVAVETRDGGDDPLCRVLLAGAVHFAKISRLRVRT